MYGLFYYYYIIITIIDITDAITPSIHVRMHQSHHGPKILEPMITSCTDNHDADSALEQGGRIVDYHSSELFPERWFDLILVLRVETHVLYDRLTLRGYSDRKRQENIECEIMGVLAEEATNSYDPDMVQEVNSNSIQDLEETVRRVQIWYEQWIQDHKS
jgi:adenylate kinase